MKRFTPNQKAARKKFTATALKSHPRNSVVKPMRGGYRI